MAEYLLKAALRREKISSKFTVCSAGVAAIPGSPASDLALLAMENFNGDIRKHRARKITQRLLDSAFAIFCMGESHRDFLLSNYKKIKKKCFLLKEFIDCGNKNIADPFFGNAAYYENTRDDINSAIDSILKFLTK
jgi:protein-tyrosine phosphatase